MMLATFGMFLCLSATTLVSTIPDTAMPVDVELVLAVDMSGSMDIEEVQVQRAGYVEALRHKEFIDAVSSGFIGRIAITYFEWAGSINQTSLVEWQTIATPQDAEAFASRIEARPIDTRRGTSISKAISFATSLLNDNAYQGTRRVIDISGDGPNNLGPPVVPARDAAVADGIIVNGLAILIRPSSTPASLDRYYADCVIGGPGSFVLPVHRRDDFSVAIRQKLVLEIGGLQDKLNPIPIATRPPVDCMIGEKLRPGFLDR